MWRLAKEVYVASKTPGPDVRGVGGGGKTNISLLESSEEEALGLRTLTTTQKFGEWGNMENKTIRKIVWLRLSQAADLNSSVS